MKRIGDVQAALASAALAIPPIAVDTTRFYSVVTPAGHERDVIDFEPMHPRPRRAKGTARVHTARSFCDLYRQLAGGEDSDGLAHAARVYADDGALVAVLNDHAHGLGGWGDHRIVLGFQADAAYVAWVNAGGRMMSQVDFAEFIEDNVDAISEPAGADILELAQSFRASKHATFSSDKRLSSGQTQIAYQEVLEAAAGKSGQIEIPDEITLALPILRRGPDETVRVKLRYRLHDGMLTLGVRIVDRDGVWRRAVDLTVAAVETELTLAVIYGMPPDEGV